MPYKLFYHPNTASLSTHWILVELEAYGVEHTLHLVDFQSQEQKTPSFLALNPKGRVPTLLLSPSDPLSAIAECSAILLLLSELHPSAQLVPLPGSPDRARFLEIYVYIANTLLPALRDLSYADRDGDKEGAAGVLALARKRIRDSWAFLDQQLEGREYLVGDELSVADFLAAGLVSWNKEVQGVALDAGNRNIRRWSEMLRSRPSWTEVVKREGGWVV